MEEADRILINSLISIGLELPDENVSFEEFNPDILIGAAGLCLDTIFKSKNDVQTFPKSCPDNMASRYKVGQALVEGIKLLGYRDTIGYQSFLYPNVKESRRIVSFLIENLPKDTGPTVSEGLDGNILKTLISSTFNDNWRSPWLPRYCHDFCKVQSTFRPSCLLIPFQSDRREQSKVWFDSFSCLEDQLDNDFGRLISEAANYELMIELQENKIDRQRLTLQIQRINEKQSKSGMGRPEVRKRTKRMVVAKGNEKNFHLEKDSTQEGNNAGIETEREDAATAAAELELEQLQSRFHETEDQYNRLVDKFNQLTTKHETIVEAERNLHEELERTKIEWGTKEKVGVILSRGLESVDQLEAAISKRRNQIETINNQWNDHKSEVVEKIDLLRRERYENATESRVLQNQLDGVRQDMEECRRNYQDKDNEIRVLDEKVKQVLKTSSNPSATKQSRVDFTKRILELTENKKKQNGEIRKILADIFMLQKDINSLRGKLERSFMETRDCILDQAGKKDEVSKRMYKVLLGIHENCCQLVDVIEERGRLIREIRELETIIDNEDGENIEKNLSKIISDFEEAKKNCASISRLLKEHKVNDLN